MVMFCLVGAGITAGPSSGVSGRTRSTGEAGACILGASAPRAYSATMGRPVSWSVTCSVRSTIWLPSRYQISSPGCSSETVARTGRTPYCSAGFESPESKLTPAPALVLVVNFPACPRGCCPSLKVFMPSTCAGSGGGLVVGGFDEGLQHGVHIGSPAQTFDVVLAGDLCAGVAQDGCR